MAPLVTVVIPVSERHVDFLPDALRSIARQTVDVAQVIVANDSSRKIERGDWPFRLGIINTGGHKWTSVARNMALSYVDTPFVTFLDADDALTNIALEIMLRAYKLHKVGYIYGDALVMRDGKVQLVPGFEFDRALVARRNIHTVTALVPMAAVTKIGGFDETIVGWEDWEFYIRLAEAGYCGKRVPFPLITYRLDTGANRNNSAQVQNLITRIRARHSDFIKGVYPMGCGCGAGQLQDALFNFGGQMPTLPNGDIAMEYTGDRGAPVTYNANGRSYRVSNQPTDRFFGANPADVEKLLSMGPFTLAAVPDAKLEEPQFTTTAELPPAMAPFEASIGPDETTSSVAPSPEPVAATEEATHGPVSPRVTSKKKS
jgi:hypothetical protein